jgi:hypothetical protein
LDPGFLVIGDDRDLVATVLTCGNGRPPHLDITVDAKHFGHFWLKLGIALLQIIAHLVRLHLVRRQDLAHRPLSQFRQARMTGLRPVIPRMRSQQAGRPQFVWIPKRDRLRAGKRDKPSPSFRCNHCFASRPRAVVERRQHPQFRGSLR